MSFSTRFILSGAFASSSQMRRWLVPNSSWEIVPAKYASVLAWISACYSAEVFMVVLPVRGPAFGGARAGQTVIAPPAPVNFRIPSTAKGAELTLREYLYEYPHRWGGAHRPDGLQTHPIWAPPGMACASLPGGTGPCFSGEGLARE